MKYVASVVTLKKDAFVRSFVDARRVVAISFDDNFSLISTVVLATYKMKYKLLPLLVSIPINKERLHGV